MRIPLLFAVCLASASSACLPDIVKEERRAVVARVGDIPIYLDEFEQQRRRLSLADSEGSVSAAGQAIQRMALLDDLIERRLLLRQAERANVVVGMDEVDDLVNRMRHGWNDSTVAQTCPDCVFDHALSLQDLRVADLKRYMRESLMIHRYLRDHVFSRVAVTDAEIEAFLESHPERLVQPERVRALQIVVKTKEQAEEILRDLRRGGAFEEAAMKHSLSPERETGGDLGYFTRGSMPKVIEETCFALRPGGVSKIVASDQGFHLFKVIDFVEAHERLAAEVRDEVEAELRRQQERRARHQKIMQLKKDVTIAIEEKVLATIR